MPFMSPIFGLNLTVFSHAPIVRPCLSESPGRLARLHDREAETSTSCSAQHHESSRDSHAFLFLSPTQDKHRPPCGDDSRARPDTRGVRLLSLWNGRRARVLQAVLS